jgi:hypothetical protein
LARPQLKSRHLNRLFAASWPRGFAIVQFPNPPLIAALIASLVAQLAHGTAHRGATAVFYLALAVWAYQEAAHGDNWFRRTLGVGFCVYLVLALTRALHS